jgi:hypothetical protein
MGARVAEKNYVVFGEVGFGYVLIVFHERMAAEEPRPQFSLPGMEELQTPAGKPVLRAGGTPDSERRLFSTSAGI